MNREAIFTALYNQLCTVPGLATTGRRFMLWNKVTAQPAMFMRVGDDEYSPRKGYGLPPKITLNAEVWIYANDGKSSDVVPVIALNNLVDAVESVLQPPSPGGVQTLGGLVDHCWIEGKIIRDPGDIDGQSKAKIPLKLLVP